MTIERYSKNMKDTDKLEKELKSRIQELEEKIKESMGIEKVHIRYMVELVEMEDL